MMTYDAVIFDLDGTLLDSLDDIADAANQVLVDLGRSPFPNSDYQFLVGDGVAMLFQRAVPECQVDLELRQECMRRFDVEYAKRWNNRSKPYDGIEQMLKILGQNQVTLAILSNKPEAFTKQCVEHFFPANHFIQVLGHSERFPRKPDPASAKWLAVELGVVNDRIAYVGDTNTDMKTAVGAGLFAIGVTWGFRPESELVAHGANAICNTVSQLQQCILGSRGNSH
jgi:phosphoglycolate phosphatase